MILTCCGFAGYIFLLASVVVSPDSPFQNPLAPPILQTIQITRADKIMRDAWQFFRWVWTVVSPLFKRGSDATAVNDSSHSLSHIGSKLEDLIYSDTDFTRPSPEVPVVLWVLETSTDPRIITIAAEISVGLQWPLGLDLEPPMTRLHDTFELCFSPSPGGWEGRPGHNPDPQFAQFGEVVDLAEEGCQGLKDAVDCWEDSDALQWSLHANAARGQFDNPNDTETAPLERRWMNEFWPNGTKDIQSGFHGHFRVHFTTHLFKLLLTTPVSSHLTARILHTSAQWAHNSGALGHVSNHDRKRLFDLFAAAAPSLHFDGSSDLRSVQKIRSSELLKILYTRLNGLRFKGIRVEESI
ncbi:hypothetical protein B0H13DRAFT_1911165 [Mycena leptocephala]|nr:hypothetical protein B0H13DRAFT_1911165 [Mycena leptocephala]